MPSHPLTVTLLPHNVTSHSVTMLPHLPPCCPATIYPNAVIQYIHHRYQLSTLLCRFGYLPVISLELLSYLLCWLASSVLNLLLYLGTFTPPCHHDAMPPLPECIRSPSTLPNHFWSVDWVHSSYSRNLSLYTHFWGKDQSQLLIRAPTY